MYMTRNDRWAQEAFAGLLYPLLRRAMWTSFASLPELLFSKSEDRPVHAEPTSITRISELYKYTAHGLTVALLQLRRGQEPITPT